MGCRQLDNKPIVESLALFATSEKEVKVDIHTRYNISSICLFSRNISINFLLLLSDKAIQHTDKLLIYNTDIQIIEYAYRILYFFNISCKIEPSLIIVRFYLIIRFIILAVKHLRYPRLGFIIKIFQFINIFLDFPFYRFYQFKNSICLRVEWIFIREHILQ